MKTIATILSRDNTELTKLVSRAHSTQKLAALFHKLLAPELVQHCHFAALKGTELTVTVSNSAWATRIRYLIPDLIKSLKTQPEFKKITTIRYVISTPPLSANKQRQTIKPSRENEILWQETITELKHKPKSTS